MPWLASHWPASVASTTPRSVSWRSKSLAPDCSAFAWRITTRVFESLTSGVLQAPRVAVMPGGPLMIIGGAEDKLRRRRILKEFVAASGGPQARIAVIPTASSLGEEIVEVYDALFRAEGAAEISMVRPESRAQAGDPELVAELEKATGIFMTGGNQLKLSSII